MFISRVEMPWNVAQNPYKIHCLLWRLFPGEAREARRSSEEDRQGFLFRVEKSQPGYPVRVLVQSRRRPEPAPQTTVIGCREFHPRPASGQRLAFLLTANPIKTIIDEQLVAKPDKKSNKCRVPLLKEEEQLGWLSRKLADAADVESSTVLPHSPLYFRKGNRGGKLLTVTFEGILQVRDGSVLSTHLANGIGPAKGFGCGLMLVKRLKRSENRERKD